MSINIFNEEHEILRGVVRRFVENEITPYVDEWEKKGEFPREIFEGLGELGLLGIQYPQKYGGSDSDFLSNVVFIEELSRCACSGVSSSIAVHALMASPPLANLGSEEIKERYLRPAIRGKKVGALGITEPNAGSDVAAIRTTASRERDYYLVNGSKTFITNGASADFITLAVKTDPTKGFKGVSLLLVDTSSEGFSVGRKLEKMGQHCSGTAELHFEDVRVPLGNLLGEEGRGFYGIMKNFEEERLIVAVRNVSTAEVAFEQALSYAQERKAFGKTLSGFQVIRHMLADMASQIECIKQFMYNTAQMFDNGLECRKEIAMCKYLSGEMLNRVAYDALQIHGGYGYMQEYIIERIYRDARATTIAAGTTEIMKEIIAKRLGV